MAKCEHRPTQNQRIIDYINRYGSITPLEAMRDLGIYRLASRISDLKSRGYAVTSRFVPVATRDGGKTRIKEYSLQEVNGNG
jgi:hypothetical protein